MMNKDTIEWLKDPANKSAILAAVDVVGGDGHTIFYPHAFESLPVDVVADFTETYESDGTHKGSITSGGEIVDDLKGVYGLSMVSYIARILGVDYEYRGGRGFQCRVICSALRKYLEN